MSVSVDEYGTAVRPRPVPLPEVKCEHAQSAAVISNGRKWFCRHVLYASHFWLLDQPVSDEGTVNPNRDAMRFAVTSRDSVIF